MDLPSSDGNSYAVACSLRFVDCLTTPNTKLRTSLGCQLAVAAGKSNFSTGTQAQGSSTECTSYCALPRERLVGVSAGSPQTLSGFYRNGRRAVLDSSVVARLGTASKTF